MVDPGPERPPLDNAAPPHLLISLFRQLQRRRVLKTAAIYCVGAGALMQVVPSIQQGLDLPPIVNTLVILGAVAAFLPACMLAWAFDLTPPRVLRADPLGEAGPRERRLARILTALSLLVFVAAGSTSWAVWARHARSAAEDARRAQTALDAAAFPPDHVAVLPFEDTGAGASGRYLGNAITVHLIDQLSRVAVLHVIPRAGIAGYGGGTASPDSIGRALNAGTIITGSVLDDGARVRVVARAIDAATGEVMEPIQVERPAGQVLSVLDELVNDVAAAIRERIGKAVEVRRWQAATHDEQAWRLVQEARQLRDDADKLLLQGDNAGALAGLGRSDSLLAEAERRDPAWDVPLLERGWAERKTAFIYLSAQGGPVPCRTALERGIGHADRVLQLHPESAQGLELRGVLEWWQLLCGARGALADDAALAAQRDLQAAVRLDVRLPRAWSTLAEALMRQGDWAGANAAAQRAYEEDAYLEEVVSVLHNGFLSAFQLGDDAHAASWCAELQRRKPGAGPALDCRLRLMAWGEARPDPGKAWRIVQGGEAGENPAVAAHNRDHSELLVAAVLARAGLRDSAHAVIARVRARLPAPITIGADEAQARLLLGERAAAVRILRDYAANLPTAQRTWLRNREFAALRGATH